MPPPRTKLLEKDATNRVPERRSPRNLTYSTQRTFPVVNRPEVTPTLSSPSNNPTSTTTGQVTSPSTPMPKQTTLAPPSKPKNSNPPLRNPPSKQRRMQSSTTRESREGSPVTRSNRQLFTDNGSRGTHELNDEERSDEHPVRNDMDDLTGLLPGDINEVTMIMNAAEKRIANHVSGQCNKLALDVKACESMISGLSQSLRHLDSNVSNLKVLLVQNSVTVARAQSFSRPSISRSKKGGKTKLQEEIEAKYPSIIVEAPAVFYPHLLNRVMGLSASSYMDAFHNAQDDFKMTGRTMSVLMYGLQRDCIRGDLKEGLGKRHAKFRFKIALCAVREALLTTDEVFKEEAKQVIADLVKEGVFAPGEIEPAANKPSWLSARSLTREIMENARKFFDVVKSEQSPVPKPQTQRVALYICRFAIKRVIDMLRVSRDRCKQKIFDSGLFLIADWSQRRVFKSSDGYTHPVLRFVNPTAVPILPGAVQDCHLMNEEHHELGNATLLKQFIAARAEMLVEATYMVRVVIKKPPRSSDEPVVTELREMKRQFNILRIALVFMESYMQASEDTVLSSHPSMLRNIYRVALMLREWFIDDLDERDHPVRAGTVADAARAGMDNGSSRNGTQSNTANTAIPCIQLHQLLPGDNDMEATITKVLRVSVDAYEKLRVKDGDTDEYGGADDDDHEDGAAQDGGGGGDLNGLDSDDEDVLGMVDV